VASRRLRTIEMKIAEAAEEYLDGKANSRFSFPRTYRQQRPLLLLAARCCYQIGVLRSRNSLWWSYRLPCT